MKQIERDLDFNEYIDLTKQLISRIDDDVRGVKKERAITQFSSVLGIGRGGAMLGVILSHALNKPFRYINVYYEDMEKRLLSIGEVPKVEYPVLVVDDLCDTGRTMKAIVPYFCERGRCCTATLLLKPWSGFIPDFWIERTAKWINFWYETLTKGKREE